MDDGPARCFCSTTVAIGWFESEPGVWTGEGMELVRDDLESQPPLIFTGFAGSSSRQCVYTYLVDAVSLQKQARNFFYQTDLKVGYELLRLHCCLKRIWCTGVRIFYVLSLPGFICLFVNFSVAKAWTNKPGRGMIDGRW